MTNSERIKERLNNIRTVEPILGALRTISLGSWQAAQKRRAGLHAYTACLHGLLPLLMAHLPVKRGFPLWRRYFNNDSPPTPTKIGILVIGSERGLCGGFNDAVARYALAQAAEKEQTAVEIEWMVLGGRAQRALEREKEDLEFSWARPLATSALPHFSLAVELARRWLARYEAGELDALDLIYPAPQGLGSYAPTISRLLPPALSAVESDAAPEIELDTIVETDPLSLYTRVIEQLTAISLYAVLLDSATAEHATRYQLMEGASQNAERLIDDLLQDLQSIRREQITREMQELAVGAGLLG
ncbi:MAG TPA: hypothetical protein G4N98_06155 [Thermoflexia bacterium]|nr:hypothetical protein [Thermoflexia bacterium]